ncbi:cytochrome c-type biogenesis protein [Chondromyces crocatus]|uniref:Cytochrome c-type biogenesis protein n=1 Tax=Chondromyces crocatus TaxID=52 RepID=A0A0K1EL63_CHOCO|nr:cytochrome c-type biogenesis protein CcmH [Chondromyces crocatus]AKT41353.1 uncharacterized protein CMC5_055520 [Chondromyces crocatus]
MSGPLQRASATSSRTARSASALALVMVISCQTLIACQPKLPSGSGEPSSLIPGAAAVESRLLAPCCWVQTLDVHESELATALRGEIRDRLRRGEPARSIEDDFEARFGARVRALPREGAPQNVIPLLLGIGMVLSAIGLAWVVRRWLQASARPLQEDTPRGSERDDYDERLDQELARLDDA